MPKSETYQRVEHALREFMLYCRAPEHREATGSILASEGICMVVEALGYDRYSDPWVEPWKEEPPLTPEEVLTQENLTPRDNAITRTMMPLLLEDYDTGMANVALNRPDWPLERCSMAAWQFACIMGEERVRKGLEGANADVDRMRGLRASDGRAKSRRAP